MFHVVGPKNHDRIDSTVVLVLRLLSQHNRMVQPFCVLLNSGWFTLLLSRRLDQVVIHVGALSLKESQELVWIFKGPSFLC